MPPVKMFLNGHLNVELPTGLLMGASFSDLAHGMKGVSRLSGDKLSQPPSSVQREGSAGLACVAAQGTHASDAGYQTRW